MQHDRKQKRCVCENCFAIHMQFRFQIQTKMTFIIYVVIACVRVTKKYCESFYFHFEIFKQHFQPLDAIPNTNFFLSFTHHTFYLIYGRAYSTLLHILYANVLMCCECVVRNEREFKRVRKIATQYCCRIKCTKQEEEEKRNLTKCLRVIRHCFA